MSYVRQSIRELEALGIDDYVIARMKDGRAGVLNRWSFRYTTRPKPKLPLQGEVFPDYDSAFRAILKSGDVPTS
jgi:hypothetical protein